jgi:peptidoglycan/LPS O-acetylase OafA/YrhL
MPVPVEPGAIVSGLSTFPARFRRKVSQGAYRPEIDGLRFFAIAFVIFGHSAERAARFFPSYQNAVDGARLAPFLDLAPLGVRLFFAISGFILAGQALKADASPLSARFLKSYFGRRVLRIEPPYIVLLVTTWALVSLTHWAPEGTHRFDVEPRSLNVSLVASVFYLHDLIWGTFPRLFPPGWSLEVEVQFYVLAPLLFALWAVMRGGGERLAVTFLFLATGVNLSLLGLKTLGPLHVDYSLLHYFNYFWIGIALAYVREALERRLARAPAPTVTALGWLGLAGFIVVTAPGEQTGIAIETARLSASYLCLAAIFVSTFDPRSGLRRFCAWPWISLLGGACYSIYLVHLQIIQMIFVLAAKAAPHMPLVGVAGLFVVSALVVTPSGLAYYVLIERSFMARDWPQAVWRNLRAAWPTIFTPRPAEETPPAAPPSRGRR